MAPLTHGENNFYDEQEIFYICKGKFCMDEDDENCTNRKKAKDHCHYTGKFRGAVHSFCNLKHETPKEIPIIFHNGSTYDYHFIIKRLAKEFKGYFYCLGKNTEKYITFSVPIKKVIYNNDDNNNDKNKAEIIIYRLKFIDSYRFMGYLLSCG